MTWISGSFVVLELPLELKAAAPQRFLVDSQAPRRVSKAIHENTKVRPDAVDATTRPIPPRICSPSCRPWSNGVTALTLAIDEVFQTARETFGKSTENVW